MKAVLRDQPKDIISYCADYFSALENQQLRSSRHLSSSIRQEVEDSFMRCFSEKPLHVHRGDVVKFMRYFANEANISREPVPNNIEDVLHLLRGRTKLERNELIDMVTEFFGREGV